MAFPTSPSTNQIYSESGKSWLFDGTSWLNYAPALQSHAVVAGSVIGGSASNSNAQIYITQLTNETGLIVPLTDGTTITPNFMQGENFSVTLGGNRTLANPKSNVVGQSGIIKIVQDSTGVRTLAYGSYWKFSGGIVPILTTAANSVDILVYYVESETRITAKLITDVK